MQTPMTGENSLRYWDTQSRKESTVKGVKENICIYRSDNLKGIKCWQLILVNCQTNIQLVYVSAFLLRMWTWLPKRHLWKTGSQKFICFHFVFVWFKCAQFVLHLLILFLQFLFFFNVLHFSFYISFPGVFTLFLYFGTKIHTNNTLILYL